MYKDCSIPARLFFKVASTGDLTLLPKGSDWDAISDEYHLLSNDRRTTRLLEKQKRVAWLILKAHVIQDTLFCLNKFQMYREAREKIIEILKGLDVVIRPDAVNEDILRTLNVTIGRIKNQIRLEELELKDQRKIIGATFDEVCVSIENVLERTISEDVTTYKFIAYKKSSEAKVARLKKSKSKVKAR